MSIFDKYKSQHPTDQTPLQQMAEKSGSSAIQHIVSQGMQAEMDPVQQMGEHMEPPEDQHLPLDERLVRTHKIIRGQCKKRIANLEKELAQERRALRIAEAAIAAGQEPENNLDVKVVK
jgi:hypothetical protein